VRVLKTLTASRYFLAVAIVFAWLGLPGGTATAHDPAFTTDFRLQDCKFRTRGTNPYFILQPGYRLVLEGQENGETVGVEITVLRDTRRIFLPDLGVVNTRVVEERHTSNGTLVEISRNYFAICSKRNDVVYFGEDVDIFNPDGTITHEGAWLAGVAGARPGLIMPGTFLMASRYFQEQAPGVAEDRAEHVAMGLSVQVTAGSFTECVMVHETTPLEPGVSEKIYCPRVGLVKNDTVELVAYGFVDHDRNDDDDD
jgi:hypothetical protein